MLRSTPLHFIQAMTLIIEAMTLLVNENTKLLYAVVTLKLLQGHLEKNVSDKSYFHFYSVAEHDIIHVTW